MMTVYEVIAFFILTTPLLLLALLYSRLHPPLIVSKPERRRYLRVVLLAWLILTMSATLLYLASPALSGLIILAATVFFLAADIRSAVSRRPRTARRNLRQQKGTTT